MKKVLLLLLSASVLCCTTPNLVSANKLEQMLRDHTFIYIDTETGIEHTIYIGRFGNNYDEYFPCKFVDGTWRITKNNHLCLEDRVDKKRRDGLTCLKPEIENEQITFFDIAGNLAYQSKLIRGNSMPLG